MCENAQTKVRTIKNVTQKQRGNMYRRIKLHVYEIIHVVHVQTHANNNKEDKQKQAIQQQHGNM